MKYDLYTHGFLLFGAMAMFLGIRASGSWYAMDIDNVIMLLIGAFLILLGGIFWISAAINWEKPRRA